LIEALRNASNIRNLRDTDWITLVVRGRGSELEIERQLDVLVRPDRDGNRETYGPIQFNTIEDQPAEASTMVLRLKKSALDEIARQKGSLDQFKQRVSVFLY
jgi:hypothetical protein